MKTNIQNAFAQYEMWLKNYPKDFQGATAAASDFVDSEADLAGLKKMISEYAHLAIGNAQINEAFLRATDGQTKAQVVGAIAAHYGITPDEAFQKVTGKGAEHLLDYLVEPTRRAVSALMQRYALMAGRVGRCA